MGPSGRQAIKDKLPNLIKKKKIRLCYCQWRKRRRYGCWDNKKNF